MEDLRLKPSRITVDKHDRVGREILNRLTNDPNRLLGRRLAEKENCVRVRNTSVALGFGD